MRDRVIGDEADCASCECWDLRQFDISVWLELFLQRDEGISLYIKALAGANGLERVYGASASSRPPGHPDHSALTRSDKAIPRQALPTGNALQ
jgi:hypothetical protein